MSQENLIKLIAKENTYNYLEFAYFRLCYIQRRRQSHTRVQSVSIYFWQKKSKPNPKFLLKQTKKF